MQALTAAANQAIASLSNRYGVSEDAVRTLLFAVSAGGGTMAQFYHVDLGGGGQWMRGGMTMVGDMFNSGLKSTVDGICTELSSLLATQTVFAPLPASESSRGGAYGGHSTNAWWPAELGSPSSSGGQNDSQYAYFPGLARLAVKQGGYVAIYDTLDHQIGGVQQQQGGSTGSFSFSSQRGTFSVDSLPFAPASTGDIPPSPAYAPQRDAPAPGHWQSPGHAQSPEPSYANPSNTSRQAGRSPEEILAAIERLGDLHRKGLLSDSDFQTKKADLLAQL